jgi:hypothetical protein
MPRFKVISFHLPAETKENQETLRLADVPTKIRTNTP